MSSRAACGPRAAPSPRSGSAANRPAARSPAAARRTASAPPSPRPPRPDRSDRRSPHASRRRGFSTRASSGSSAGCTKRRLAWRAFGHGSGNSRNSRSRQASGSRRSSARASSVQGADCAAAARLPRRPPAPGATAASRCRCRTPRRRSAPRRGARRSAPARARRRRNRPPARARSAGGERRERVSGLLRRERQARQGDLQQPVLPRPQPVAAAAAVQPVRRRLQRPKAAFRPGTRSVFSHVKVPFSSSGSRPKWP